LTSGTVVKLPLPADRVHDFAATMNIAYLPPQYFTEPAQRFPVVYLFHGSPGKPEDWFHAGRAARAGNTLARLGHPAILVAVQMSRSWTDDPECVDGAKLKVESHLISQVIPAVDATFRTLRDRQGRIFGGMSAGGYCALNLGLRHRDLVGTIVDLSGETVPTHTGGARVLFGAKNPQAGALVAANSPAVYASHLAANPATRVWLETGTDDRTIAREMTTLARTLTARGLTVENRVRPGGHTYYVWTAALGEALPWALGGDAPPPARPSHH
jgi:enterochelin esterase-like enzyme